MKPLPFTHSWPYDRQYDDIYLQSCPFCNEENVLTYMDIDAFQRGLESIKTELVLPCCHEKMTIVTIDADYFWTNELLRKM